MAYRVSNGASLNVDLEHLFRNNGCNKTTLLLFLLCIHYRVTLSTSISLHPIDCVAELRSLFLAYLKAIDVTYVNYQKVKKNLAFSLFIKGVIMGR